MRNKMFNFFLVFFPVAFLPSTYSLFILCYAQRNNLEKLTSDQVTLCSKLCYHTSYVSLRPIDVWQFHPLKSFSSACNAFVLMLQFYDFLTDSLSSFCGSFPAQVLCFCSNPGLVVLLTSVYGHLFMCFRSFLKVQLLRRIYSVGLDYFKYFSYSLTLFLVHIHLIVYFSPSHETVRSIWARILAYFAYHILLKCKMFSIW